LLVFEAPNVGVAANGDRIAVTGGGEFSVNPNAVDAAGEFTHTESSGNGHRDLDGDRAPRLPVLRVRRGVRYPD
jgi:hypothetical protein